jgi:tetratricopeptide (TPR) repeat protein
LQGKNANIRRFSRFFLLFLVFILRGPIAVAQSDSIRVLWAEAAEALKNDNAKLGINKAKTAFEKAILAKNDAIAATLYNAGESARLLANAYRSDGKTGEAAKFLLEAVHIFEKTTYYERLARSLAELGRIKQGQRNFAEAIELYTQALSIYNKKLSDAEAAQSLDLKAFIFERMALILTFQKQYDQAETYGIDAYNLCEKVGEKGRWEITATTLGNIYFWKENYEKAAIYYKKAYELSKDIGRNTGRNLNNLGIVAAKSGNSDKAIDYYLAAIEQYKLSGAKDLTAQTQINISEIYNDKGDFNKAISFGKQGVEELIRLKSLTGLVEGYENLVTAYMKSGDLTAALNFQKRFTGLKDSLFASNRQKELLELQTKFESEKKDKEIKLLNNENALRALQLQQKNLELTNQELLTEKNQDALLLLRQTKTLQESELARTTAELGEEKLINDNKTTQLVLNQRDIQVERQQVQLTSNRNSILRGVIWSLVLLGSLTIGFIWYWQKNRRERELLTHQRLEAETLLSWQSSELKALRSQINPHFIFNCLNAVKGLVLQNHNEGAAAYITKFSKLVRLVLENSRSEWITLEKELETLTLYLDIEQMRFNNRFKFWINLENDVDTEGVKLPPMLIQPYVENAIWHGLMHKEGTGNVTISIAEKTPNQLEINIVDDGIGRQKATALKSKTAMTRKSYGMEISADRLKIIRQIYPVNIDVFIYDLTDPETGEVLGTRVQLLLSI